MEATSAGWRPRRRACGRATPAGGWRCPTRTVRARVTWTRSLRWTRETWRWCSDASGLRPACRMPLMPPSSSPPEPEKRATRSSTRLAAASPDVPGEPVGVFERFVGSGEVAERGVPAGAAQARLGAHGIKDLLAGCKELAAYLLQRAVVGAEAAVKPFGDGVDREARVRRRVRCVDYPGGIEIIGERHQPGAVAGGDDADVVAALLQAGPAQQIGRAHV